MKEFKKIYKILKRMNKIFINSARILPELSKNGIKFISKRNRSSRKRDNNS